MLRVLMPDARRWPQLDVATARRLGRAEPVALRTDAALKQLFGIEPQAQWPTAALTRLVDSAEAPTHGDRWLRADPAWIKADINGGKLLGVGETLPMDAADVTAFLPSLTSLFSDTGLHFDAPTPHRWYLRVDDGAPLPTFSGPSEALGDDAFEHFPDGPAAAAWRRLLSETQVVLHHHPHNAARMAAGRPPVNSLWFWGAGPLPNRSATPVREVWTRDAALAGMAHHQGLDIHELVALPIDVPEGVLLDLRAFPAGDVARDLVPHLLTREAIWLFEDRPALELHARHRWRLWRAPRQVSPDA